MFKPIRWNRFPRDLFVIEIGFILFALAIALSALLFLVAKGGLYAALEKTFRRQG